MKRKLLSSFVLIALTSSLLTGILASPVQAEVLDMTCTAEQKITYSPGVTLFPSQQNIQLSGSFTSCLSASRPDITGGSVGFSSQGIRSCFSLDRTISGTSGILWNTGETTTYTYTSTTATVAGQIIVTILGTVTAGVFEGDAISVTLVSPVINVLNCLIPPGITSRTGVGTLAITSLQ